jgi:D-psicose/D-tagatose/L-ribulose 3-epimerase
MKFGVNTLIWTADFGPSEFNLLPCIKASGFDGVEIPLFRPAQFAATEIRRAVAQEGLECTACAVLVDGLNLISESAEIRNKTRTHLQVTIKVAAELGAATIVGPMYCPVGHLPGRRRTADEWAWAVEGFQSLGDTLVANGVTLAIEPLNRFETYFLNTAADGVALAQEIGHPNIGILFDTFHANIEEKNISVGCRTLSKHLKYVHTCENDRGIPGSGHVEWDSLFETLRDLNYDGWLTIESFGFALGDISAAASIWRDIERTPDLIAFEGIKFLKKMWAAA